MDMISGGLAKLKQIIEKQVTRVGGSDTSRSEAYSSLDDKTYDIVSEPSYDVTSVISQRGDIYRPNGGQQQPVGSTNGVDYYPSTAHTQHKDDEEVAGRGRYEKVSRDHRNLPRKVARGPAAPVYKGNIDH